MGLTLQEQIRHLTNIQEIDLKIDQINKTIQTQPEPLRIAEETLQKSQKSAGVLKLQLAEFEKNQKQIFSALEMNRERTQRTQGRMDQVSNTKEFQASNKELDQLKRMDQTLEEQKMKLQLEMERLKSDLAKLNESEEKAKSDRDRILAEFANQVVVHKASLESLAGERKGFLSQLDAPLLTRYDRIRQARGGLGLVPLVGGRCKGCNMMVSPQIVNDLYRCREVQECSSCRRILFLPESVTATTEAATA